MSITERLMAAGTWDIRLLPDTPPSVLARLDLPRFGFGHFVFTPAPLPVDKLTDADMLAQSRYTGVYRRRPGEFEFGGAGPAVWLGDEDGKGPTFDTATGAAGGGWPAWLVVLQPTFLGVGIRSAGGAITGTYLKTFARTALRTAVADVCARFDAEWRVSPQLALDLALREDIYRIDPTAVVVRRPIDGGRDYNLFGLVGGIELDQDLEDWTRRIRYYTGTEDTPTLNENDGGVATTDTPYRAPDGTYAQIDRIIEDFNSTPTADGAALAALQYGRFDHAHEEIRLSSIEYDIGTTVVVGDNLWVYDPERGLVDMNNPKPFRGSTIFPTVIRCVGHTWPIRQGMGVYFRRFMDNDTATWSPDWVDLTPFVAWETGTTTLDIGSIPRTESD